MLKWLLVTCISIFIINGCSNFFLILYRDFILPGFRCMIITVTQEVTYCDLLFLCNLAFFCIGHILLSWYWSFCFSAISDSANSCHVLCWNDACVVVLSWNAGRVQSLFEFLNNPPALPLVSLCLVLLASRANIFCRSVIRQTQDVCRALERCVALVLYVIETISCLFIVCCLSVLLFMLLFVLFCVVLSITWFTKCLLGIFAGLQILYLCTQCLYVGPFSRYYTFRLRILMMTA